MIKNIYLTFGIFACIFISCNSTTNSDHNASNADTTAKPTPNSDPLPSWNDGASKKSIMDYVAAVTKEGSPDFIKEEDRIATFDNDGTLWSEQPLYFQLFYALDKVKSMAPQHPDWKAKEPFKSVLNNDMGGLMKQGSKALMQVLAVSHAGMSSDEFESSVSKWIDTANHPTKKRHYNELVYQPMLELIKYLQNNHFKVFIVSGGGVEFMRAWAEKTYGIPKDQIIGSSLKETFTNKDGKPTIEKEAVLDFMDDKEGKPVAIQKYIGRKPVFAGGNSDGDLQMLQWTASNSLKNFELYVHHTDSTREWDYDRTSKIGTFNIGYDEALAKKWTIVDMKNDWKVIYPFEK